MTLFLDFIEGDVIAFFAIWIILLLVYETAEKCLFTLIRTH